MRNKQLFTFLNELGYKPSLSYGDKISFNVYINDECSQSVSLDKDYNYTTLEIVKIIAYQSYKMGRNKKAREIAKALETEYH